MQCPNCLKKRKINKQISGKFSVYFCQNCHNGFTYPVPKDIGKYYHDHYWTSSNIIGLIKNAVFDVFQKRRVNWIVDCLPSGTILDVGSGEGKFGSTLPQRYDVVNIEPPGSKVKSNNVIKKDFLKWNTNQKFDAICFWESLEHTPYPQKYLEKAYQLLKRNGKVFIEFPQYDSLEARVFGKHWFHLDLPRHLSHLTNDGVKTLLKRSGFENIKIKGILSVDYAPWGLAASLFNAMDISPTDAIKKTGNLLLFILVIPMVFISFILEIILLLLDQSPIALAVADKK